MRKSWQTCLRFTAVALLLSFASAAARADVGRHVFSMLIGGTAQQDLNALFGVRYGFFLVDPHLTIGALADLATTNPAQAIVAAPFAYQDFSLLPLSIGFELFAAPGARFEEGRGSFAFLTGIGLHFSAGAGEGGGWFLSPTVYWDVQPDRIPTFFGLSLGRRL